MLLRELFDHRFPSLKKELRNAVLDVLTPMSSHGAQSIPIQSIIDRLKKLDLGIDINADTIRSCVDANTVPFVSDIDDTTIYLNGNQTTKDSSNEIGEPKEPVDPIANAAKKQASASMGSEF